MKKIDGYAQRYSRVYRLLKRQGFSPAKALEIIIDAKRRDAHALLFVKLAASAR